MTYRKYLQRTDDNSVYRRSHGAPDRQFCYSNALRVYRFTGIHGDVYKNCFYFHVYGCLELHSVSIINKCSEPRVLWISARLSYKNGQRPKRICQHLTSFCLQIFDGFRLHLIKLPGKIEKCVK